MHVNYSKSLHLFSGDGEFTDLLLVTFSTIYIFRLFKTYSVKQQKCSRLSVWVADATNVNLLLPNFFSVHSQSLLFLFFKIVLCTF
jgi:hypothetical protein